MSPALLPASTIRLCLLYHQPGQSPFSALLVPRHQTSGPVVLCQNKHQDYKSDCTEVPTVFKHCKQAGRSLLESVRGSEPMKTEQEGPQRHTETLKLRASNAASDVLA